MLDAGCWMLVQGGPYILVPTLCVGTSDRAALRRMRTLRNAERRSRVHAERGNEILDDRRGGDGADTAGERVDVSLAVGMQAVREEDDEQVELRDRSTSPCR